ncbi:MAG: hypothetical protein CMJ31_05120 [Phycisphaerae bacterium]|nr:hypothetical protein [Phycisphaerae bacterium]
MIGAAGAANAGIVSFSATGGHADATWSIIAPPTSVGSDDFNDRMLRGFAERQNITLDNDLILGGQRIAAGTTVNAFGIFWDPRSGTTIQGDIRFDTDILGVATTFSELAKTDPIAGLGSVTYKDPTLRGLESNRDSYAVAGDTLSIDFRASSPGDFIRVFTAVPTPGAVACLAAAGVGAVAIRRRR